jgi:hypothetical protein
MNVRQSPSRGHRELMKPVLGRYVAIAAVVAVGVGVALGTGSAAAAGGSAPWEPDPQSVGTITFYNAAGTPITSGSTTSSPMAAFAVGSTTVHAGDTTAVLIAAQPNSDASTANWNTDFLSGFTSYPISSGAPASIQTLSQSKPVVTGKSTDLALSDFIAEFPSDSGKPGYKNVYQLRLKTANGSTQTAEYDVADVIVSGSTWSEVYPIGGGGGGGTIVPKPKISGHVKVGSKVTCVSSAGGPYAWHVGAKKVASSKKYKIPASAFKKLLTCTAHGKTSKAHKVARK